ncbi:MAG: TetR/AcrR family transcriptional regulator [Bacteroidota bacterium]
MKKTKQKILATALELYNEKGVGNLSIRQLAKEVGISHSNLIYHYPSQEDVILGLHELLLQKAMELNQEISKEESPLVSLFRSTQKGFAIVYDFRFLFKDLQYICSSFPRVKETIRTVEEVRSRMYRSVIELMKAKKLIRSEEREDEFKDLITLIKIYSDHWLESSSIYDDGRRDEKIRKYAYLLMSFFYPYLTDKGKEEFQFIERS